MSVIGTIGGAAAARTAQTCTKSNFNLPPSSVNTKISFNSDAVSINAGLNLNRKLSRLAEFQTKATITKTLPEGRIRYYDIEKLSKTNGPTRGACNVLEWDPIKGNVRGWYECHDHFGNVNRVHPKNINGQIVSSPHYPPTAKDLIK